MKQTAEQIFRVAILVDSTTSWSRSLIEGILAYSKTHGPWHIHLEPQQRNDHLSLPESWQGQGIIARVASHEMAAELDALGIPLVNISSVRLEGVDCPRVITDPSAEARLAFGTFRSRGFRNFAYVGDLQQSYVAQHFAAYKEVVENAGFRLLTFSPGQDGCLQDWLRSVPKPIGLYCWGPGLGHKVIDACQLSGIHVPYDVAVLGSNYDELLSAASFPPQAGIRMAAEQIGMTAAAILDGMMHGRPPEKREWLLDPMGVVETDSIDTVAVDDRRMAGVMRYLNEHALDPITVDDVLRAHPMARRSMERKFRQLFGCSVIEQIRRLRINHARMLLAETDAPVTGIAEQCGFSSYNYLNRIFKKGLFS